ncbi:MAG: CNNM domain-containing protein, partial [Lachnospiraceae bacterium]|nr:CNNM domain-containing protein [Lachnospiraceae bacterium]
MDPAAAIQTISLVILVLLSAFFSSAETALTTVNRVKVRALADEGNRRAKLVLKVTDDSAKMLSAILVGNNVVNLSASSIATILGVKLWNSIGAGIATGILTVVILIFGEIVPKTAAHSNSLKMSLRYAGIILAIMNVLTPIIYVINA